MKKKLTAMVTAAAMMVTMVPSAVLATESAPTAAPIAAESRASGIDIQVFNFNNTVGEGDDYIFVFVTGSGAEKGQRYSCILKGVSEVIAQGELTKDGENKILIPKSKIPNINDPYAANVLTINITNASGSTVLYSKSVNQEYAASAPTTVTASVRDGSGTTDRLIDVAFDSNYYPSSNDSIRIDGLDANGNVVGTTTMYYGSSSTKYTNSIPVTYSKLSDDLDSSGMRSLANPLKVTFDAKAVDARVRFFSDGKEMTKFSKTVPLAPRYGELKSLELVFDNYEIYRGETITGHLYYVNTEGKRYDVSDSATMTYIDGGKVIASSNPTKPEFTVKEDAAYGENVIVMAKYGSYSLDASKILTVSEKLTNNKVKVDRTSIKVGAKTTVNFSLLNASGGATTLGFKPTSVSARLIDCDDSTAKLSFTHTGLSNLTTNGTMSALVDTDKPCKGKLELTFTDGSKKYRVVTDTITFTKGDITDKRTVTLTFGSKIMDINGVSKQMDVAPLAYQNRTFVPLRAVGDAFDAETLWNPTNNKITITYGSTVIEMTPGSPIYSVNGVTKPAMDVSPYVIAGVNRTMIPVRFVSTAMGFDVDTTTRPDGTVEKVIIKN